MQACLTFFYKIHSGIMSLEKDNTYVTPAPNFRGMTHGILESFSPRAISLKQSHSSYSNTTDFKALI